MGDGENWGEGAREQEKAELAQTANQAIGGFMPEERIYVIPLGDAKKAPRQRRTKRSVGIVRDFLRRHMKSEEIKLDQALNCRLWGRGMKHPLPRVRVRAVKQDDGSVEAFLAE